MTNVSAIGLIRAATTGAHAVLLQTLLAVVAAYRYALSPMIGRHCRYHPSCSEYAQEALSKHGVYLGAGLAVKRLCRCHPWHPGGYDPVP